MGGNDRGQKIEKHTSWGEVILLKITGGACEGEEWILFICGLRESLFRLLVFLTGSPCGTLRSTICSFVVQQL